MKYVVKKREPGTEAQGHSTYEGLTLEYGSVKPSGQNQSDVQRRGKSCSFSTKIDVFPSEKKGADLNVK